MLEKPNNLCMEHSALMQRLDHASQALENCTKIMQRLNDKLDTVALDQSHTKSELVHINSDISRLATDSNNQWSIINSLRAKVYMGVGLATAASAIASFVVAIFKSGQ